MADDHFSLNLDSSSYLDDSFGATEFCSSEDIVDLLANEIWDEPEQAQRLNWNVDRCMWDQKATTVRIMRKFMDSGDKYVSLLMVDNEDSKAYVLKVGLHRHELNAYDSVRCQNIASSMAKIFNGQRPPVKLNILPCLVVILSDRDKQPAIRCEPLVRAYTKINIRNEERESSPLETDLINAFELFSYHTSHRQFLLWNPFKIRCDSSKVFWTEPSFFSVDGAGGLFDTGLTGINGSLLRIRPNHISSKMHLPIPECLPCHELSTRLISQVLSSPATREDASYWRLPDTAASLDPHLRRALERNISSLKPKSREQAEVTKVNNILDLSLSALKRPVIKLAPPAPPRTKLMLEDPNLNTPGTTGLVLQGREDGTVVVSEILPDSAASEAPHCIFPGDQMLEIDKMSIHGVGADEVARKLEGAAGKPVLIKLIPSDESRNYHISLHRKANNAGLPRREPLTTGYPSFAGLNFASGTRALRDAHGVMDLSHPFYGQGLGPDYSVVLIRRPKEGISSQNLLEKGIEKLLPYNFNQQAEEHLHGHGLSFRWDIHLSKRDGEIDDVQQKVQELTEQEKINSQKFREDWSKLLGGARKM